MSDISVDKTAVPLADVTRAVAAQMRKRSCNDISMGAGNEVIYGDFMGVWGAVQRAHPSTIKVKVKPNDQ